MITGNTKIIEVTHSFYLLSFALLEHTNLKVNKEVLSNHFLAQPQKFLRNRKVQLPKKYNRLFTNINEIAT